MGFRGGKTDDAAEDAAEDVVAVEAVEVVVEDGEAAGLAPVPIAEDGAVDDDDADYVDTSCWGKCWCRTIIMVVTGGFLAHIPAGFIAVQIIKKTREEEFGLFIYFVVWVLCMHQAWNFKRPGGGGGGGGGFCGGDEPDEDSEPYVTTADATVDEYYVVLPVELRAGPALNSPVIKTLQPDDKLGLLEQLPDTMDGHVRCRVAYYRKKKDKEPDGVAWTTLSTEGLPRTPPCYRWLLLFLYGGQGLSYGTMLAIYVYYINQDTNPAMLFAVAVAVAAAFLFKSNSRFKKKSRPLAETFLESSGGETDVPSGLESTKKSTKNTLTASLFGANPMVGLVGQLFKLAKLMASLTAIFGGIGYTFNMLYFSSSFCGSTLNRFCNDPTEYHRYEIQKMGVNLEGDPALVYRDCDRVTANATRAVQLAGGLDGCGCPPGQAYKSNEYTVGGECVALTGENEAEYTSYGECATCGKSGNCLLLPEDRQDRSAEQLREVGTLAEWEDSPGGDYGDPPDFDTCGAFNLLSCAGSWGEWGRCLNLGDDVDAQIARRADGEPADGDFNYADYDANQGQYDVAEHACGPGGTRLRQFETSSLADTGIEESSGYGDGGHGCDNSCTVDGSNGIQGCGYTSDGECDETTGYCPAGSDSADCCENGQPRETDLSGRGIDASLVRCGGLGFSVAGVEVVPGRELGNDGVCSDGYAPYYDPYSDPYYEYGQGYMCYYSDQSDCTGCVDETAGNPMYAAWKRTAGTAFYSIDISRHPWGGDPCEAEHLEVGGEPCNDFTCPECPPGTYSPTQDAADLEDCADCEAGKVAPFGGVLFVPPSGALGDRTLGACTSCPMGMYAPAVNGTDCVSCPAGTHTTGDGGDGIASCVQCATTTASAGYDACLGGSCEQRHVDAVESLCGGCIDGYYMEGVICRECGTGWFTIVVVLLGIIAMVAGVTYAAMTFVDLSGDIEAATGGFDLYMAFSAGAGQFQRLLQVVTINYQFPQSWVDLANYLRAFIDFDLPSLAEPECQIKMSAMGGMLLRTRMMALMIPAIVFMVAIGIAIKMRKSKDVSVRGALFIIFEVAVALHSMFFIAVTKAALAPFDCTDIGNTGTSRLDRNNAAICDELDGEYQSLRTWGFGMLLIFGLVFPLLHLPNWVETVGLLNKMIVIGTTTFLSAKADASKALMLLLISATTFATVGFGLRRNCGQGFRVIQIGSSIEIIGYIGGSYFVWCGEENGGQPCSENFLTTALGVALGSMNIGFVVWAIWMSITESAKNSQDVPSVGKHYTVVAEATIRSDCESTKLGLLLGQDKPPKLGQLQVGTRCKVWEDSTKNGQIQVALERDETGALAVNILACKQLAPKDLGGNDVEVEIIVNGMSKKTPIKLKSKADVEFLPEDGEIKYRVSASEPIETSKAVGAGSKSAGFLDPKELITVYEEKKSGGHTRVRIDPLSDEKDAVVRWASKEIPTPSSVEGEGEDGRTIDQMKPVDTDAVGAKFFFENVDSIDELRIVVVDVDFNALGNPTSFDDIGATTLIGADGAGSLKLTDAELGAQDISVSNWFYLENEDEEVKDRYLRITSTAWVNDPWTALSRKHEWVQVSGEDGAVCIVPSEESSQPALQDHRVENIRRDVPITRGDEVEMLWGDYNDGSEVLVAPEASVHQNPLNDEMLNSPVAADAVSPSSVTDPEQAEAMEME